MRLDIDLYGNNKSQECVGDKYVCLISWDAAISGLAEFRYGAPLFVRNYLNGKSKRTNLKFERTDSFISLYLVYKFIESITIIAIHQSIYCYST